MKKSIKYVNGYCGCTAYPRTEVFGEKVVKAYDLPNHESSSCWVLETENFVYLQSYNTIVSRMEKSIGKIYETKHSVTTSRQQTWFANAIKNEGRVVVESL